MLNEKITIDCFSKVGSGPRNKFQSTMLNLAVNHSGKSAMSSKLKFAPACPLFQINEEKNRTWVKE